MDHQQVIDSIKQASIDIAERIENKLDGQMLFSQERFEQHEREEWSMFDTSTKQVNSHIDNTNAILSILENKVKRNSTDIIECKRKTNTALILSVITIAYNIYLQWILTQ